MKITKISEQLKRPGRYSVFVDNSYSFSLSETALLDSQLYNGQDLSPKQVADYRHLSSEDKLQAMALRYIAMRSRSRWEMEVYLKRKDASPALIDNILNKLSDIELINDAKFAESYVSTRRLLRPASRRKIAQELKAKHVPEELINQALGSKVNEEQSALQAVIAKKRRISGQQDDLKLMQYLSRQGFSYGDIKQALKDTPKD